MGRNNYNALNDRRNFLNKIIADKSMNVKIDAIDYKDLNN
jgi:hypothetical protein